MKHLEQIKELINSEIGRFATVMGYIIIAEDKSFEEYEISFTSKFNPIYIKSYSDGRIQVKVDDYYELTSTIDSSCCYLYIALMNAKRES